MKKKKNSSPYDHAAMWLVKLNVYLVDLILNDSQIFSWILVAYVFCSHPLFEFINCQLVGDKHIGYIFVGLGNPIVCI